jgi:hypothetical protein
MRAPVVKAIESRLSSLKRLDFEELLSLPAHNAETGTSGSKRFMLSVWKDVVGSESIRIVVQGYRPYFLGIGRMAALGFVASRDGTVRNLESDELYEFR